MNLEAVTTIGILFLSTFTRSTFGFGDALIAMPLLAMTVGMSVATPLVALIASTIAITILIDSWRSVRIDSAWRLILSSLVGIPIGLIFIKGAYEGVVKVFLALIIVSFSTYSLLRPTLFTLVNDRLAYVFGLVAGILGGAYNTNGPAVVIYGTLRRWPVESFRATLQGYFFPTGLFIVIGHGLAGLWTPRVLRFYVFSLPVVLVAILLGARLSQIIPKGKFERYVHLFLIAVGVALFFDSI